MPIIFNYRQVAGRLKALQVMVEAERTGLLEVGSDQLGTLASSKAPVQVRPRPEHGGLLRASWDSGLISVGVAEVLFAPIDERNNYVYAEVQETHDEFSHIIGQSSYLGDSVEEYGPLFIAEVATAMRQLM